MSLGRIMLIFFLLIGLTSCNSTSNDLHYQSANSNYRVKSLIMHFTAVDYANSKRLLVDEGGLSAHYLIPQNNDASYPYEQLKVLQLVDENERAWHAGVSHWQGRNGLNDSSIGIEIVNVPHCAELTLAESHSLPLSNTTLSNTSQPNATTAPKSLCIYPDFDTEQVELLIALSKDILARNPDITPTAVVGHSDIAPTRKHDPGPRFPWFSLYQAGVGAWYDNETISKYWQIFSHRPVTTKLLQQALQQYGYGLKPSGKLDKATISTIEAFQMHFLPWQVNGNNDARTAAAVFALLEKYFPERAQRLFEQYEQESKKMINTPVSSAPSGQLELSVDGLAKLHDTSSSDSKAKMLADKRTFFAYQGSGKMHMESEQEVSADFFINGEKLNLAERFLADSTYTYSLSKRTHTGLNLLQVGNITPDNATINIRIEHPILQQHQISPSKHSKHLYALESTNNLIHQHSNDTQMAGALLVAHKGRVITQSTWGNAHLKTDSATNNNIDINTLFDLDSLTSLYATRLAVLQLASHGQLSLDTPVSVLMNDFNDQNRELITVQDLMSHTSGLPPAINFYAEDASDHRSLFSKNKIHTEYLISQRIIPEPSFMGKYRYSRLNDMLLGLLIERLSGQSLDEYINTHLLTPLSLSSTMFAPSQLTSEFKQGVHALKVNALEVNDPISKYSMQGVSGHAGLFASMSDVSILTQLLLNKGGYADITIFDSNIYERAQLHTRKAIEAYLDANVTVDANKTSHKSASAGRIVFAKDISPLASNSAVAYQNKFGSWVLIDPQQHLFVILLNTPKSNPSDLSMQVLSSNIYEAILLKL